MVHGYGNDWGLLISGDTSIEQTYHTLSDFFFAHKLTMAVNRGFAKQKVEPR